MKVYKYKLKNIIQNLNQMIVVNIYHRLFAYRIQKEIVCKNLIVSDLVYYYYYL